jgi:thioesterase domain-containing protein
MDEFASIPRKQDHSRQYGEAGEPAALPNGAAALIPAAGDAVAEAWERIFGVPASRGDHLLDVLINSHGLPRTMQLNYLLAEIGDATGVRLPLTVVYGSPTAAALAEMVQKRDWPPYARPVLVQSGVGLSLFVLPGVGGMGLDVVTLARYLSFSGPVYFNPPKGIDGTEPDHTIDTIVAGHIAVIRSVQPHGPYWLLGHSWGGVVALEIARSLRASGEMIAFLGMIEPMVSERNWPYGAWLEFMGKRLRSHLMELGQLKSPSVAIPYVRQRLVAVVGRIGRLFGFNQWSALAAVVDVLPAPLDKVLAAESEAIDAYRLHHYDGEATLFAMRSGHASLCDPKKIWPSKFSQLDLQWVAGDHESIMIEPSVRTLAEAISAVLAVHRQK